MSALPNNLVVIIAGSTGVGKSDVAAKLCERHSGLIVSADSVQAYRGVQIGANKPTPEERLQTPHLLVDVADASEKYNAAEWRRDALKCIERLLRKQPERGDDNPQLEKEIADAKKLKGYDQNQTVLPVVVGGTMMYLQWLVHGRPDAMQPSRMSVQKARIEVEKYQERENGWNEAIDHVASLDPVFKRRVHNLSGQDWYRLRRTMEIAYTVLENDDPTLVETLYNGQREGGLATFGYDVRCFFLCPDDRMQHTSNIDQRCEKMIIRGLIEETTDLECRGELPDMATKAIGYRQVLDYLTRDDPKENDAKTFDEFLNDFTTATRRYAKRQMQWFRKDNHFAFIPVSLSESKSGRVEAAANLVDELCRLPRAEYDTALLEESPDGTTPLSFQTRQRNEEQGKKMKFYQFKRYELTAGSEAFEKALKTADECSRRINKHQSTPGLASTDKRPKLL